jgi:hypothetical protein|tara:strand:- start:1299 stop:2006 length:708 start_codon:yes stop_codon:yes gene_type:complete
MGLPKLETKTYTLTLPSTGKEIKYRPFLMKEQKTMMMAQESQKDNEIVDVMSQLITDCTFNKVDAKTSPLFDAEYIFLKLRSKSVGEKVKVVVTCPDDKETKTEVEIDISEVECHMTDDHSDTVEITDEVKIIFNYPLLTDFTSHSKDISQTDLMFKMINQCIKEIHYGETVYNKVDLSEKDTNEFMDSLSTSQFTSISKFFDSMPKLRHVIKVTNPNTKVEGEVLLEGLQSFLV